MNVSDKPASDNYKGPFPGSEAETKNVMWLVANFPIIGYVIDIHSGSNGNGETILWGWSDDEPQHDDPYMNFENTTFDGARGARDDNYKEYMPVQDEIKARSMADNMRNAIRDVRSKSYITGNGTSYYQKGIPGTATDYCYSRQFAFSPFLKLFPAQRILGFGIEFATESPLLDWNEMSRIIEDVDSGLFQFCLDAVNPQPLANWAIEMLAHDYSIYTKVGGGVPYDGPGWGIRRNGLPFPIPPFPFDRETAIGQNLFLLRLSQEALQISDKKTGRKIHDLAINAVKNQLNQQLKSL